MFIYILPILAIIISILFIQKKQKITEGWTGTAGRLAAQAAQKAQAAARQAAQAAARQAAQATQAAQAGATQAAQAEATSQAAKQQQAQSVASVEQNNLASQWIKEQIGKAPQPTGVQTGTTKCHIENCVKPEKVRGGCIGETDPTDRRGYNDNPIEKSDKSLYKSCNHTCLMPGTSGYKDLMPAKMADYKVELHGCRTDEQCKDCGRVAVSVPNKSGFWKYIDKGASGIKRFWTQHSLKFDDSNKAKGYLQGYMTSCEQKRVQGLHKNSCPADLWTPEERKRKKAEALASLEKSGAEKENTVTAMSNNADTTTGNMFLDVTNPSHIGKKDMSIEDYYNRRILNNNKENRLGGSKSLYTDQYKPDNKRKIQYFNSVWKLF